MAASTNEHVWLPCIQEQLTRTLRYITHVVFPFSNAIETFTLPRFIRHRARGTRSSCSLSYFRGSNSFEFPSITFFSVFQSLSALESVIFRGIAAHKRPFELSRVRSQTMKQGTADDSAFRSACLERLRSIVCTGDR